MWKWIEDKSVKRNFEIDHTIYRYFIKTPFIVIGERIRLVKYREFETSLVYSRVVGMNEKYMFKDTFLCNYITLIYKLLDNIFSTNEVLNDENLIISSRFIKNKIIREICEDKFIAYKRDNKINQLLS